MDARRREGTRAHARAAEPGAAGRSGAHNVPTGGGPTPARLPAGPARADVRRGGHHVVGGAGRPAQASLPHSCARTCRSWARTAGAGWATTSCTSRSRSRVVLGLTTQRRVVIVGIGNLGHALASYSVFAERGFAVVGLVDADPAVVGTRWTALGGAAAGVVARRGQRVPTPPSASSRRPPPSRRHVRRAGRGRCRRHPHVRPAGPCACRRTWTCGRSTWPPSCRSSRSTTVAAPARYP